MGFSASEHTSYVVQPHHLPFRKNVTFVAMYDIKAENVNGRWGREREVARVRYRAGKGKSSIKNHCKDYAFKQQFILKQI